MSLRIFHTPHPTGRGLHGSPIQPMTAEQRRFWRLFHDRKEQEKRK